jgi:hypothetical protein
MPVAIAALESGKAPEECDYPAHLNTERAYLASHKKEPEADITACKYIELLMVYDEATCICSFVIYVLIYLVGDIIGSNLRRLVRSLLTQSARRNFVAE